MLRLLLTFFFVMSSFGLLAQSLPQQSPPAGFHAAPMASGRLLISSNLPTAKSPMAVAKESVQRVSRYFDGPPQLGPGIVNRQTASFQATFSGKLQNVPIYGLMIASLRGSSSEAIFVFDRPGKVGETLKTFFAAVGENLRAMDPSTWRQSTAGDGSGRVSLPPTWRVLFFQKGALDAVGPNGEGVSLGAGSAIFATQGPYMEPLAAFQQMPAILARSGNRGMIQPTRIREVAPFRMNGNPAAFILSDAVLGGVPFMQYSLVSTTNFGDRWMYYSSSVGAPAHSFPLIFGSLLKIWQSWALNPAYLQQQFREAMGKMQEASAMLTQSSQVLSSASFDQTKKGWGLYIRDNDIVEQSSSGSRYEVPARNLQSIVDAMNQQDGANAWRVVPISEY